MLAKATGADRGRPGRRRTPVSKRWEAPRAAKLEGAWFIGHRESVRKLLPRYRRGRPEGRRDADEAPERFVVDRPGLLTQVEGPVTRPAGNVAFPRRGFTDRSGPGHLYCSLAPPVPARTLGRLGKSSAQCPSQEGGRWATSLPTWRRYPRRRWTGAPGLPPVPPLR